MDCDALSEDDWTWAAVQVSKRFSFRGVYGVPTGGAIFEKHLRPFIKSEGDYFLIVDDVLTTGGSMEDAKKIVKSQHKEVPRIGVVLFARTQPAPWIASIWKLW